MYRAAFFSIIVAAISFVDGIVRADVAPASGDCLRHFTSEGSFFSGRKYTTWAEFPDVSKTEAFTRVYTGVAKDGWKVTSLDRESGTLSVAQAVSFGKGSTAPMIMIVEATSSGSKVTATFRTGGGQAVQEGTIKTKMCSYINAATA